MQLGEPGLNIACLSLNQWLVFLFFQPAGKGDQVAPIGRQGVLCQAVFQPKGVDESADQRGGRCGCAGGGHTRYFPGVAMTVLTSGAARSVAGRTVHCPFRIQTGTMPSTVTDLAALDTVSSAHLLDLDSQTTLVMTVNNRHARRLLADLSGAMQNDQRVVPLPAIVPLSAWFRQAADQLSFLPGAGAASHYLDAFAARGLWQQVITDIESDEALLDVGMAARLSMDADALVDEWHIEPLAQTDDYRRFVLWRSRYRERLLALDAEDANTSIGRVCAAIADNTLLPGCATLVLAGFHELSPRLSALLSAMQVRGVKVLVLQAQRAPAGGLMRIETPDTDSEWWQAAQWAKSQLQSNPKGRYAIIGSRLEADVVLAHRAMRQTLPASEGYNIAVARPLAEWPMVRAAIAWLGVMADFRRQGFATPERLGAALLSGACVASQSERAGRARLDARWRQKAFTRLSIADFGGELANGVPQLHAAWTDCVNVMSADSGRARLNVWSERFRDWLTRLGFPGQGGLGSAAFQTLEAFDRALGQLGQYSVVWGQVALPEAVSILQRLVRETLFQPQRDPSARVDVLGLLEAEGGRWDGVWVLGLTDEVLPAPTRPNPLLPAAVLRQAGAPRATPERELQWAAALFDDVCRSAPTVWFSHASHEGERELRPSPFIAQLPLQLSQPPDTTPSAQAVLMLESLLDDRGPALVPDQGVAKGGIGLIEAQSRNPLWAFVKYRLGASQLPDYAQLADQNARGQFLHRAMELLWRDLVDQDALAACRVDKSLADKVVMHLGTAASEHLADYGEALRRLEVERAQGVVLQWLDFELQRMPFATQSLEETFFWQFGPLGLKLRLDRVDRLHDGRLAVVDYKTGNASADPRPNWTRPRPIELQLPFYASVIGSEAGQAQVGALVLAHLHARSSEVKGVSDGDYGWSGLADRSDWPAFENMDWPTVLSYWRKSIEGVAREYIDGVADNRFEKASDLDYCDVLAFLRLNDNGGRDV